jgi:hypothetical protein
MYRTHYRMDAGLTVRDWRYAARVCNIDVSDLATVANTKNLINSMIKAAERIPSFGGRPRLLVRQPPHSRVTASRHPREDRDNLTWESVSGKRIMTFDEHPGPSAATH